MFYRLILIEVPAALSVHSDAGHDQGVDHRYLERHVLLECTASVWMEQMDRHLQLYVLRRDARRVHHGTVRCSCRRLSVRRDLLVRSHVLRRVETSLSNTGER